MALILDSLLDTPLSAGVKGLPDAAHGLTLRDASRQNWGLLEGDVPLPAAVLRGDYLSANLTAFQHYITDAGARLAPHGKTTMCPQLFDRQLEAGAWGLTVATYAQAHIALKYGVKNLLIANELVGQAEIEGMAALQARHPDALIISLVDSSEGLERIETYAPEGASFNLLVELGISGGRCGVRGIEAALEMARKVSASQRTRLLGIEGYEGLIVTSDPIADALRVNAFLDDLLTLFNTCRQEALFEGEDIILSAGGTAYFDLVAKGLPVGTGKGVTPILRSGCYLTHDTGFYDRLLKFAGARALNGPLPALKPALEVWAQVVSHPEPDLIIIGAGRRDLADDSGLPKIEQHARPGPDATPRPVTDWQLFRMNDQHGYVRVPEGTDVRIGDYVGLGISHPCTTFDRWPVLLEVDEAYRVTDVLKTFF